MRITVKVFFRSITVRNKELIPSKGPLMIVANHPGTFMDPIVIATMLNREVYFLAKGELFKGSLLKWMLGRLNMIPVYRKQDDPGQMSKNQDTFVKCYEHLERGGAILIFPEGTSITERKLRPIKTGAARIVLGAEAKNDFKLGAQILTIGLNYVNPHKFNRDLFINLDTPIKAIDFKDAYSNDSMKTSHDLTEAIRIQLEKLIIAINDTQSDELIKDVENLYKSKRLQELGFSQKDKEADFTLTKKIVEIVQHYQETDPERAEYMRMRIKDYLKHLRQLGLEDEVVLNKEDKAYRSKASLNDYLTIVLGFPFYLYGLVNNFLPFEIPAWIARKVTTSVEYRGPIGMVLGIFTFSIFYTIQIILMWKYSQLVWLTVAYGISLPVSGFFTYWYYHTLGDIKAKWILMTIFYKKSTLIENLINERKQLIEEFHKVREEYAALNNSQL